MKQLIKISIFFLTFICYSQKEKGQVFFLDGTVVEGYVKISENKIKYKQNISEKSSYFDYSLVQSINITNNKNEVTKFEYVYFDFQKKPLLLKIEIEGYLTLYSDSKSYFTGDGFRDTSTLYLKKKNDKLGQWFLCNGYVPKVSFNKVIENYFSDCKGLQDKIKFKEIKRSEVDKIVSYYNLNCSSN